MKPKTAESEKMKYVPDIENRPPSKPICQNCGINFPNERLLRNHQNHCKEEKGTEWNCSCGCTFSNTYSSRQHQNGRVRDHVLSRKNKEESIPLLAEHSFEPSPANLSNPPSDIVEEPAINEYGRLQCDECSKDFHDDYQLKRHKEVHTNPEKYSCPQCNAFYTSLTTLRIHRNRCIGAPTIPPDQLQDQWICSCGDVFDTKGKRMSHMRVTNAKDHFFTYRPVLKTKDADNLSNPPSTIVQSEVPMEMDPHPTNLSIVQKMRWYSSSNIVGKMFIRRPTKEIENQNILDKILLQDPIFSIPFDPFY